MSALTHTRGEPNRTWSDANLPAVRELPVDESPRGGLEAALLRDVARRLAAELEEHRCEVLRGGLHDDAPDGGAAREEDRVPLLAAASHTHTHARL